MNIYTVTFSTTLNVGAELQMYALSQFLLGQGHNVQVLNYVPPWLRCQRQVTYPLCHCKNIVDVAKHLILLPSRMLQIRKYNQFDCRYVHKTVACHSVEEVTALPAPDYWITGSDQVWNLDFVGEDDVFFLNIPVQGKKISYAASAGKDVLLPQEKEKLITKIHSLSSILVREDALKETLEDNTTLRVFHVLDPVFLLNKEQYLKLSKKTKYSNYVFVYCTKRDGRLIQLARHLADKHNLIVIEMNRRIRQPGVDVALTYVSPDEFLGLIHNAHFVVTNSFHCTAFSIIFRKQFCTVPLDELNSRIASLLRTLGWQEKAVLNDGVHQNLDIALDYSCVEEALREKIEQSKKYLQIAIREG